MTFGCNLHKPSLHLIMVIRITSHREINTRLRHGLLVAIERHTACETLYAVDIESLIKNHLRNLGNMIGRNVMAQDCHIPTVLALTTHPIVVIFYRYGGEADAHIEFGGLEEKFLHYVATLRAVGLEKNSER